MSEEMISKVDDDTLLVTSTLEKDLLEKAVFDYRSKSNFHSTTFNESDRLIKIDMKDIDNLAFNAQNDLNKIERINGFVRYFINVNDIIGKVYEAIESNVNAEYTISFPRYDENDKENFQLAEEIINNFNEKIGLESLITTSIPMTYSEGNYIIYLRKDPKNGNYQVDYFPLGVAEIADYSVGGEPYVLINMKTLKDRLRKNYKKGKNNKSLFFNNMEEEIKESMPEEVYQAFLNKEPYAKLDIKNTGVMRINNLNRKYGLSPIFRAMKPAIRLENTELADDKNNLARGKKIIFQKLSKELFTNDKNAIKISWSQAQAKAHVDLMTALNQGGISVYTGVPWSEKIDYVEPSIEPTSVQTKNYYKNMIMNAIGISFLNADKGSYGAAKISVEELMKIINKISSQLESILQKWYKGLLQDFGLDPYKYCPKIKVTNSEKMNIDLRMNLARLLHNELNVSLQTVYETIGLDIKTEVRRRQEEKEMGYDQIFVPRMTAFTNSGNSSDSDEVGNPRESQDKTKEEYDRDYNEQNNR